MPAATGALKPHLFKNASYMIGSTEFAQVISKCRLVPTTDKVTFVGMIPEAIYNDTNTPTWVWQITGVQSWGVGGLAKIFHDNAGMELDVVITPNLDTGESATFTIISEEVEFGGDQGTQNISDMVFAVQGQPVFATGESS